MAKKSVNSEVAAKAMDCVDISIEADGANRAAMLEDLLFSHGDQWPAAEAMQRQLQGRPMIKVNLTDAFIRQVANNIRQQRPRIRVHPVDGGADIAIAKTIEGLFRHIEVKSNADLAYDIAVDNQIRMGLGYIRITADYITERSFDQDLYIKPIANPFSVYFDPSSEAPDGTDAQWCVIVDRIRKEEFKKKYPWATDQDFTTSGEGTNQAAWSTKEETMIAEYWRVEMTPDTLFKLANGQTLFKSDAPEGTKTGDYLGDSIIIDMRPSMKRVIRWSKVTKTQELESREWAGRYIPIVPVYGASMIANGKVVRYGMTRQLKDPQRMYNFWKTQETEFVALAPKAPWLIVEGQIEDHESEWATANVKNHSTLTYKPVLDEAGNPTPPPQRIAPTPVPAASINAAQSVADDLKSVAGMFNPALGAQGNETSGDMVMRRQQQSDMSNYHFYDNLTRSISAVGVILLDLSKTYYSGQRVIRIIGADGNPDTITINEQRADEIINDISVGEYDVVMETGPGYNTKRQEASIAMMAMMQHMPQLGQVAGDLIVGQMDWPGAQELAERLKMINPIAQQQDKIPENIDPKAKSAIAGLMGQLNKAQQELQQLQQEKAAKVFGVQEREKAITDRETMKEFAETQRTHLREDAAGERNTQDNETWMQDTHMKVATKMDETRLRMQTDMAQTLIGAETNLKIHHKDEIEGGTERA